MIDTDKYEGHTPAPWMMGEYKGRPSIHAGNETFVRSIARGLNPSQTADHALIADAPLLLAEVKRLQFSAFNLSNIIYDTELAGQKLWEEKEELEMVLNEYEADPETTGGMFEDLRAEVKRLREEVEHLLKYQGIVEEYDVCFAPEDHTSPWQLLMEEHRGEEE